MKNLDIPLAHARTRLSQISEAYEKDPKKKPLRITKRGKPTMTVMSCEFYDEMIETMEILSDHELMMDIGKAGKEIEGGNVVEWDELRKELGG